MTLANQILGLAKGCADAYKTYLSTRQEAYNRQKDKKQEKAIRYAEESFHKMRAVFEYVHENFPIPEDKNAGYQRLKKIVYRLHQKFNKFD